jgi:hypothetical protein
MAERQSVAQMAAQPPSARGGHGLGNAAWGTLLGECCLGNAAWGMQLGERCLGNAARCRPGACGETAQRDSAGMTVGSCEGELACAMYAWHRVSCPGGVAPIVHARCSARE